MINFSVIVTYPALKTYLTVGAYPALRTCRSRAEDCSEVTFLRQATYPTLTRTYPALKTHPAASGLPRREATLC